MKTQILLLLLLVSGASVMARGTDSTKVMVPTINYHTLDSLIRTNDLTAVFFWPSWCSGCREKWPQLVEVMRGKKSITFISVNDADSRSLIPKKLVDYPDVIKGYYRMKRQGEEEWFRINDMSQFRYFYWYYTKRNYEGWPVSNEYFMLFNRKGRLLYTNNELFDLERVKTALAKYN